MGTVTTTPARADARRNRERILVAARDLVVERGPDVPLEEVARAAGVGIGTLYRRFGDRQALLRAVVLDALEATATAARDTAAEGPDPAAALARYLRVALELRVSAVIPAVLDVLDLTDPELAAARTASARAMQALVDAAHAAGALPADVTAADVGMMLVRIARPLPGPMPPPVKHELARRHLELFVRGLLPAAAQATDQTTDRAPVLGGPELSLSGLRELAEEDR